MTAFLSCFNRRSSAASSPCPLNWSIWATENQFIDRRIPVLNITPRSPKEGGELGGLLLVSILIVSLACAFEFMFCLTQRLSQLRDLLCPTSARQGQPPQS